MRDSPVSVLIVEDTREDFLLTRKALTQGWGADVRITHLTRASAAVEELGRGPFDAVLLDLALPDTAGLDSVRSVIEGAGRVPVIVLTSNRDQGLALDSLRLGAQDYVVKDDLEPESLAKAVRYAISRSAQGPRGDGASPRVHALGDLRLDLAMQKAWVARGGENLPLDLTPFELKMLFYFVKNAGRELSRDELIRDLWGSVTVSPRTVDTHVSHVRTKILPSSVVIVSVRSLGYRLIERK